VRLSLLKKILNVCPPPYRFAGGKAVFVTMIADAFFDDGVTDSIEVVFYVLDPAWVRAETQ
jgi:hypothetical protein